MLAAAAVVLVAGGLITWGTLRSPGPTGTSAPAAGSGPTDLEQQLLDAERTLAQEGLQDRKYLKAITHAERALGVQPDDREALRVREAARQALDSADAAAGAARQALQQGDTTTASRRLEELLEIRPEHPAVTDLTTELNAIFRPQAEQAREAMRQSEVQARRRGASGDAVAAASSMSREGAGAFTRGEYATATERFLSARDEFTRAGRQAAEAARQAEARSAPAPTPVAEKPEKTPPVASPRPETPRQAGLPPEPRPEAPPVRASTTPSVSSAPPSEEAHAVPPATTPAVPPAAEASGAARKDAPQEAPAPPPARGPSDEEQIRALVGDYGRAIATKDLELFRRVKPNLSGDEEHRLKEAFEVGEQDVEIQITAVEVSGDSAQVRLVRHDTIGGNALAPFKQVLSLGRGPGGWRVESIGR